MAIFKPDQSYAIFETPLSRKTAAEIKTAGAEVFCFAPMQAEKIILDEQSISQLANLSGFDWLIFTDVYAVDHFIKIFDEQGFDLYELDLLGVCALGEAVADRLRFRQIHADVIPPKTSAAVVIEALQNYLPDAEAQSYLAVTEISDKLEINNLLKPEKFVELPIYQAKFEDAGRIKALVRGGAINEFVFTSPEDVLALRLCFETGDLHYILPDLMVSATEEITFQTLREQDFRPILRK